MAKASKDDKKINTDDEDTNFVQAKMAILVTEEEPALEPRLVCGTSEYDASTVDDQLPARRAELEL